MILTLVAALSLSPGIPAPLCHTKSDCCQRFHWECGVVAPPPMPETYTVAIKELELSPGLPAPCLEGDQRYVCTHQKK